MPAAPELLIRKVRRSDAPAVASLLGELGYPCSAADAARRLARMSRTADAVFAAVDGGAVVGIVAIHLSQMLHIDTRWARITTLVVTETKRRRRVGEALLLHAEQSAMAAGAVGIELTCGERRKEAHPFYMSHGYVERRKRFFKSFQ